MVGTKSDKIKPNRNDIWYSVGREGHPAAKHAKKYAVPPHKSAQSARA